MSDERLWKPTGRVADAAGAGQAAWAVLLLVWGGLVAVSSYAFTTIQGVMDQGWGAVFLAGLGAASAAALALAAMCFGLAGLAVGVRRIWPLPAAPPAPLPAAPLVPPLPTLADYEDTASEKRVAALERQLGDAVAFLDHARKVVDENTAAVSKIRPGLDAAIAEGKADAERAASARLDAVRKTWDHAFDQLRKRQDAFEKEVKVTLADSARDAKASVDGTIAGFG